LPLPKDGAVTRTPLPPSTLARQAADVIRERIASGELRGGDRLIEAHIASQLEVSRGPVREALRLLSAEGLVREEPRRGMFVMQLTPNDVRDIYDLRIAIESRAARLLIERGDPGAIASMRALVEELRHVSHGGTEAARVDFRFHETVCLMSGNQRLHGVFVRHATELRTLLRLDAEPTAEALDLLVRQHDELTNVVASHDSDAAEASFRRHLEEARERMVARFRDFPMGQEAAGKVAGASVSRGEGK
jgi:GntR family transcriptional regulator of gluconate operon